jgi:uroporphyrin-III C-methyltransferase
MTSDSAGQPLASSRVAAAEAEPASEPGTHVQTNAPGAVVVSRALMYALIAVAGVSLVGSGLLWQKLANIQEQLARQSQDAGSNAIEARALAKQAQELARETATRQAVLDTRLGEVAL